MEKFRPTSLSALGDRTPSPLAEINHGGSGRLSKAANEMAGETFHVAEQKKMQRVLASGEPPIVGTQNYREPRASQHDGEVAAINAKRAPEQFNMSMLALEPASRNENRAAYSRHNSIKGARSVTASPGPRMGSAISEQNTNGDSDDASDYPASMALDHAGLGRLEDIFQEHSVRMDTTGERFVEAFEKVHTVTMQNLAKMKTFDLKVLLAEMQTHAHLVRTLVLENYEHTRSLEVHFAGNLHHTAKEIYQVGIQMLLERTNRWNKNKMRASKMFNDEQLQRERVGSREEQKAALTRLTADLTKTLKDNFDSELARKEGIKGQMEYQLAGLTDLQRQTQEALDHSRNEIKKRDKDLLGALTWRAKYDDECTMSADLAREVSNQKAQFEAKAAQSDQITRMETARRDREIERFRGLVHTLEAEVRDLRDRAQRSGGGGDAG
eukprot:CAMPEP_0198205956 /NCGR_PEP_ID=MMETSP1445-20131203/9482_1 /TAXON_ID=36898 /ORGANISM="Pyramimonas sp., Strain CCMP2087" /LENGTH=439 /DNA_ID=CAMNT_0043878453 /DNA_START=394 /DNA_END=1709 /DNA_ORIENTATION=+